MLRSTAELCESFAAAMWQRYSTTSALVGSAHAQHTDLSGYKMHRSTVALSLSRSFSAAKYVAVPRKCSTPRENELREATTPLLIFSTITSREKNIIEPSFFAC